MIEPVPLDTRVANLVNSQDDGDGVWVLRLSDPDRHNALGPEMATSLHAALAERAADPATRVIVLAGDGSSFSSGGDLNMLRERMADAQQFDVTEKMAAFYGLFGYLRQADVPVIAAVHGNAIGAGATLALLCDLVVVAEDTKLAFNFVRLGLHPGMGSTWLLPRLVGHQQATQLLLTGKAISGQEAVACGLALTARPAAEVFEHSLQLARTVASGGPVVRQIIQSLRTTWDDGLEQQLYKEASAQSHNFESSTRLAQVLDQSSNRVEQS